MPKSSGRKSPPSPPPAPPVLPLSDIDDFDPIDDSSGADDRSHWNLGHGARWQRPRVREDWE